MGNREAATQALLKWIDALLPGSSNRALYEQMLGKMTNRQFDELMHKLDSGEEVLWLIAPNLTEPKLDTGRNLKLAKELGHNFFQRLWLTDHITGTTYLTPIEYLVVDLPLRRQQQMLVKKISIPEDNTHVDELSGQPTGPSKSSRVSFPELQVLFAQGMDKSLTELIKCRGGDEKAFRAMNRRIIDNGGVSIDSIAKAGTRVKSTETLSVLLRGMHIASIL